MRRTRGNYYRTILSKYHDRTSNLFNVFIYQHPLGSGVDEGGEACDIIVDDISQGAEPGFRDGIISLAVDEVVANGLLYFSSAGNYRTGYRFTSVSFLALHRIGTKERCASLSRQIRDVSVYFPETFP